MGRQQHAFKPPITITNAAGVCSASPTTVSAQGVSVTLENLSYNAWFSAAGSVKVWVKKASAATWSSYILNTPVANPFRVPYSSFSPALGTITAGTQMQVVITGNATAICPSIDCGGGAVSNIMSFTAANCAMSPSTKRN